MIHKNIKIILSSVSLGYAIYQFIEGFIGNGIFFTLLSVLILSCSAGRPLVRSCSSAHDRHRSPSRIAAPTPKASGGPSHSDPRCSIAKR